MREKRKSAFRRSELIGPRSKVRRFDEGLLLDLNDIYIYIYIYMKIWPSE